MSNGPKDLWEEKGGCSVQGNKLCGRCWIRLAALVQEAGSILGMDDVSPLGTRAQAQYFAACCCGWMGLAVRC